MKKLSLLILVAFIVPIFSPIVGSFRLAKQYTYASEGQIQNLSFREIETPTASIGKTLKPVSLWKQATGTVSFSMAQDMFTLRIPKTFTIEA